MVSITIFQSKALGELGQMITARKAFPLSVEKHLLAIWIIIFVICD